jgi:hypothetical protein
MRFISLIVFVKSVENISIVEKVTMKENTFLFGPALCISSFMISSIKPE